MRCFALTVATFAAAMSVTSAALAFSGGITGRSTTGCNAPGCHQAAGRAAPMVVDRGEAAAAGAVAISRITPYCWVSPHHRWPESDS